MKGCACFPMTDLSAPRSVDRWVWGGRWRRYPGWSGAIWVGGRVIAVDLSFWSKSGFSRGCCRYPDLDARRDRQNWPFSVGDR
ncbi:hypothetical protein KCP69_02790 [Salmonella enterica subsp. enterica]|nr:hypothetical protein KCP69_02790 [Salmonella enterica subsp. enterica]